MEKKLVLIAREKIKLIIFGFAVPLLLLTTVLSSASASQIHFDLNLPADTPGSISYDGGETPLKGNDIPVDIVTGVDTPVNNGISFNIIDGLLNFETGNLISYSSSGGIETWTFSNGGSLTLTGTVDADGDGVDSTGDPAGDLVYGGAFYSNIVLEMKAGSLDYWVTIGSFSDSKNEDLVDLFGMPNGLYDGGFNISFQAEVTNEDTHAFESTDTLTGDLTNMPIPIHNAFWLLGSGLLGLVGVRRKLRK